MKKILLSLLVVALGTGLFSAPEDNFKKAGIAVGGSIGFSYSSNNPFHEDDYYKFSSLNLSINPDFDFFLVDNLSIGTGIDFQYTSNTDHLYDNLDIVETVRNYSRLGLSLGGTYYFVNGAPFVPAIGLSGGLGVHNELGGSYDGDTVDNETSFYYWNVRINPKAYYFLNDSLAIYGSLGSKISSNIYLTDSNGESVDYGDDYDYQGDFDFETNFYIGVTYFVPNSLNFLISKS